MYRDAVRQIAISIPAQIDRVLAGGISGLTFVALTDGLKVQCQHGGVIVDLAYQVALLAD